ncbi:hypothetical protein LguiB_013320 [Lonicera macranthoides]
MSTQSHWLSDLLSTINHVPSTSAASLTVHISAMFTLVLLVSKMSFSRHQVGTWNTCAYFKEYIIVCGSGHVYLKEFCRNIDQARVDNSCSFRSFDFSCQLLVMYAMMMREGEVVEKVRRRMDFYVNTMKLKPEVIAAQPNLLSYSVNTRIRPRYCYKGFGMPEAA